MHSDDETAQEGRSARREELLLSATLRTAHLPGVEATSLRAYLQYHVMGSSVSLNHHGPERRP